MWLSVFCESVVSLVMNYHILSISLFAAFQDKSRVGLPPCEITKTTAGMKSATLPG